MGKFNLNFNGLDLIFLLMAVIGGLALAARMALLFLGMGDHHVDMTGGGVDTGDASGASGADHGHTGGTGDSLQFLSIQGLMGFFVMFGLVGLAMHRGNQLGDAFSILVGFLAGLFMMLVIGKMMQMLFRLQSSGNVTLSHAVGHVGTVYMNIPEGGTGQVELTIDGRMRIYDAVTQNKKTVKTGDRVEVTEVIDERILVVVKV